MVAEALFALEVPLADRTDATTAVELLVDLIELFLGQVHLHRRRDRVRLNFVLLKQRCVVLRGSVDLDHVVDKGFAALECPVTLGAVQVRLRVVRDLLYI